MITSPTNQGIKDLNLSPERQGIVNSAVQDILWYANKYSCSISDSRDDWLNEEHCDNWLRTELHYAKYDLVSYRNTIKA